MIKKILIGIAILAVWTISGIVIENHTQANRKAYAEAYNCTWGWSKGYQICK